MIRTRIAHLALLAFLLSPMSANALLVSTSVGDFNVKYASGTFDALSGALMSQAWWSSSPTPTPLALELRDLVGTGLGLPNSGGSVGPLFAFSSGADGINSVAYNVVGTTGFQDPTLVRTFAVAELVAERVDVVHAPEIDAAGIPLSLALLSGIVGVIRERRIKVK